MSSLLSVRRLVTEVTTGAGPRRVVDDVSFDLDRGRVLGLVGESGSGKSLLSLSLLGLLPPGARTTAGQILLQGRDLVTLNDRERRSVRGKTIGMVFQEPLTSFDPVVSVGDQIAESLRLHLNLDKKQARRRAVELLDSVGIPRADRAYDEYPFQLSGGMRQRALIAMALGPDPDLLIADEPTTALDVTLQAQILALIKTLQRERGIGVLFISHNLGVIAEVADDVMVMYGGQVLESAPVESLFDAAGHPYTQALLAARPRLGGGRDTLVSIPGQVPTLEARPPGCPFHPRCPRALGICGEQRPVPAPIHRIACWNPAERSV